MLQTDRHQYSIRAALYPKTSRDMTAPLPNELLLILLEWQWAAGRGQAARLTAVTWRKDRRWLLSRCLRIAAARERLYVSLLNIFYFLFLFLISHMEHHTCLQSGPNSFCSPHLNFGKSWTHTGALLSPKSVFRAFWTAKSWLTCSITAQQPIGISTNVQALVKLGPFPNIMVS
jgi:hypothetical protein